MKKLNINSKKGFTIIEVVLVLAIAGLIFLMIFIALPNLQRTQRDTQRRNDVDRVSAALVQYVANNNRLPNNGGTVNAFRADTAGATALGTSNQWGAFVTQYLLANGADRFEDPNGLAYIVQSVACGATTGECTTAQVANFGSNNITLTNGTADNTAIVTIVPQARCSDTTEGRFTANPGARKFAVAMGLEGSGIYCVDN